MTFFGFRACFLFQIRCLLIILSRLLRNINSTLIHVKNHDDMVFGGIESIHLYVVYTFCCVIFLYCI